MDLSEIRADIDAIENDFTLHEETNFANRAEAIDYIDFHIIDRIEGLMGKAFFPESLLVLKQRACSLKTHLEKIDAGLFQQLRTKIQSGMCRGMAFGLEINKYMLSYPDLAYQTDGMDYDNLDILINGIFPVRDQLEETKEREAEMVFYQKTPARIVFEMVEKGCFTDADVFYDLGSGLGQVCILVNLLSGATSKGVEFDPGFCSYASACASALNLENVEFINADARSVSYPDATVIFMYTPFTGSILDDVLAVLHEASQKRTIRLFTYGPCTEHVAQQKWLISVHHNGELYEFTSIQA